MWTRQDGMCGNPTPVALSLVLPDPPAGGTRGPMQVAACGWAFAKAGLRLETVFP